MIIISALLFLIINILLCYSMIKSNLEISFFPGYIPALFIIIVKIIISLKIHVIYSSFSSFTMHLIPAVSS